MVNKYNENLLLLFQNSLCQHATLVLFSVFLWSFKMRCLEFKKKKKRKKENAKILMLSRAKW